MPAGSDCRILHLLAHLPAVKELLGEATSWQKLCSANVRNSPAALLASARPCLSLVMRRSLLQVLPLSPAAEELLGVTGRWHVCCQGTFQQGCWLEPYCGLPLCLTSAEPDCSKLQVLALSPALEELLSETGSWQEFALLLRGLAQLGRMLGRAIAWPSLPCSTPWIQM